MSLTNILLIVVIVLLALTLAYAISLKIRFVNPWKQQENEDHFRTMNRLNKAAQESAEMTRSHLANGKDMSLPLNVPEKDGHEG